MFFKMLKSDLKRQKGLNVVLLLFMTAAAVLVFVGSVQVYQFFTGNERNKEVCNISDILMFSNVRGSYTDKFRTQTDQVLSDNANVTDYYRKEMLEFYYWNIDFENLDESEFDDFKYSYHYFMTQPENSDLLFDIDDKPFYAENGTVYVEEKLRNITGANIGDKIKITTDMGNIYELEIAGFFKQPYLGGFKWYVISDADYKLLSSEQFFVTDLYGLKLDEPSYYAVDEIQQALKYKAFVSEIYLQDFENSNDYILGYVLSVFLTLISFFLILIIVMTIRFTMIAALKEEEKEIGMMRAMGVDSFSFRWLFAAKYISFAVIGGLIGVVIGFPLSETMLSLFGSSNIKPESSIVGLIGIFSVAFIILIMIMFSMIVMRRINKISVISAIHGEDNGESFGKSSVMYLHKRKIMPISFYLASSDIVKRFKRYVFLFIAYTLGIVIMLLSVNIKNTVISTDYMKYALIYRMDFFLQFNEEQLHSYVDRAVSEGKNIWDLVNQDIADAGIPAYIDNDHHCASSLLLIGESEINITAHYGKGDISQFSYREGGTVPKLKNEAAISYFTASRLGIQIGDTITLSMPTYSEDGLSETSKKEEFTVTAYLNVMESGTPCVVLGNEYENSYANDEWLAMVIDAEGKEKEEAFSKLQELFGEETAVTGIEYVRVSLYQYDQLFTMLEYVMGGAVIFILVLMTYLYSSIFITEEKQETALLKSMGFTEGAIKASHILRIFILSAVSVILGEIILKTAGQAMVGQLMETLEVTGFGFLPEYTFSFIVIPIIVIGSVLLTQWLNLKGIDNIAVWNITDE